MYVAKDTNLGYAFYDVSVDTRAAAAPRRLIGELRRAIDDHELVLHYQPKIAVHSGRVVGVEALVRWQHPDRGPRHAGRVHPRRSETSLIQRR